MSITPGLRAPREWRGDRVTKRRRMRIFVHARRAARRAGMHAGVRRDDVERALLARVSARSLFRFRRDRQSLRVKVRPTAQVEAGFVSMSSVVRKWTRSKRQAKGEQQQKSARSEGADNRQRSNDAIVKLQLAADEWSRGNYPGNLGSGSARGRFSRVAHVEDFLQLGTGRPASLVPAAAISSPAAVADSPSTRQLRGACEPRVQGTGP